MRALMPGSYDPITAGHLAVIEAAAATYDEVTVAVFINPKKTYLFTEAERLELLRLATAHLSNVTVDFSDGMVADYARGGGYDAIVKGIRNEIDRAYEEKMAEYNLAHSGVPTVLLPASSGMLSVSSTAVREALSAGAPIDALVPGSILPTLLTLYAAKK